MKKYILPIIIILVLLWLAFDKVSNIGLTEEFKVKQDSLVANVDSMKLNIIKDNAIIDSLEYVDQVLTVKLDIAKKNVKIITKYVDSSKSAIDNFLTINGWSFKLSSRTLTIWFNSKQTLFF